MPGRQEILPALERTPSTSRLPRSSSTPSASDSHSITKTHDSDLESSSHRHSAAAAGAKGASDDDGDSDAPIVAEQGAEGVARAEAFTRLLRQGTGGRSLLVLIGVLIWISMFVYALDNGLTGNIFTPILGSLYGKHSQISAVTTASSIISAISKPFLGKMSDITSRPTVYSIALVFYVVGFIVAATSETWAAYIIGLCFTSFAKSGIDLMADIIVSDLTPLQWRQFFAAGLSSPYLITAYVGGFLVEGLGLTDQDGGQWRWALGMFCILMPAFVGPLIVLLYILQYRARKHGLISFAASGIQRKGQQDQYVGMSFVQLARKAAVDIDLFGLVLLAFGFGLLLLPFSLAKGAQGGWSNPSMIAMVVVGVVLLVLFGLWEQYGAPIPLAPRRVLRNRAFLIAVVVDICAQLASFVASIYFSSYIFVTQDLTDYQWTAFTNTTTVGLVVFGLINGVLQRKFHRFKLQMFIGGLAKLLGYCICLTKGGRLTTDLAPLAVSRILLSMGGMTVGGARIASQAAVSHRDLATVIFTVSLWSSIGSSVGSAISASIWQNKMVPFMREELPPSVTDATIKKLYASIRTLKTYARDDVIRTGTTVAYQRVLGIMFIIAIVFNIIPLVLTLFVPNYYLGAQRNLVARKDLDGNEVDRPVVRDTTDEDARWDPSTASTAQKVKRQLRIWWDAEPRRMPDA